MDRRSFIQSIAALVAAPALAKADLAVSITQPKGEKNTVVDIHPKETKPFEINKNIGGIYKDDTLIMAFSNYDIEKEQDISFAELHGMRGRIETGLLSWSGSADCEIVSKDFCMTGETYQIRLFDYDIETTGTVLIVSLSESFDNYSGRTTSIEFKGTGELTNIINNQNS